MVSCSTSIHHRLQRRMSSSSYAGVEWALYAGVEWAFHPMPVSNELFILCRCRMSSICRCRMSSSSYAGVEWAVHPMPVSNELFILCRCRMSSSSYAGVEWAFHPMPVLNELCILCLCSRQSTLESDCFVDFGETKRLCCIQGKSPCLHKPAEPRELQNSRELPMLTQARWT
jgi:hypothetical protein